jgi:glycosyltransferase involved in cell wall biosynthesis
MTVLAGRIRRRWKGRKLRFTLPPTPSQRRLLVDVSNLIQNDARTGIQRVVRALLRQLAIDEGAGYLLQPVFASRDHGYCLAAFDPDNGRVFPAGAGDADLIRLTVRPRDVFLGLDLAANIVPHVEDEFVSWRRQGVSINFIVYDLLPHFKPEWFRPATVRNYRRWLGVLARQSDRCLCITRTVAHELGGLVAELPRAGNGIEIHPFPLGADLAASFPTSGLPAAMPELRQWLLRHRVMLCVGTVEPRKGHDQALAAFSKIWLDAPSSDLALLFIGRPGWMTEYLQRRIREHPEFGQRLRWLDEVSDELLRILYNHAHGLLAVSRGEGFGLPLVEALQHGLPVLARDLPVFREIGDCMMAFFADETAAGLAALLLEWVELRQVPDDAQSADLPTWSESAAQVLAILGLGAKRS